MTIIRHELPELIPAARAIAGEAQLKFGGLSPVQLNWQPAPDKWSVGLCLDHLLIANAHYLPIFEAVRSGRHQPKFAERLPLLPTLFGNLLLKAVSPQAPRKLRAPKIFQPAASDVDPSVVRRFTDLQAILVEHFIATLRQGLGKFVITSPVSPIVTYSLLDACRIIVAHEQRHFQQAERVVGSPGFPAR
jgi:hypothetical protein